MSKFLESVHKAIKNINESPHNYQETEKAVEKATEKVLEWYEKNKNNKQ